MHSALTLAAVWGVGMAFWLFPDDFLRPGAGWSWRMVGDAAKHAVAQRYFNASEWVWPPLNLAMLGGLNLAFADGIPLLALPLKALAPLLPAGFHGIGLWYALVWILTPLCAGIFYCGWVWGCGWGLWLCCCCGRLRCWVASGGMLGWWWFASA